MNEGIYMRDPSPRPLPVVNGERGDMSPVVLFKGDGDIKSPRPFQGRGTG